MIIRFTLAMALALSVLALSPQPAAAQTSLEQVTIDEIRVKGFRRSEEDAILTVIRTKAGQLLDRRRLRTDIKAVFQLGLYTDVQVDLSEAAGRWLLTFYVVEKPSIRSIRFEGNNELDDDELREVTNLKAFGILEPSEVNRNAEKLKDLYIEKGYFLAEVSWDLVEKPDQTVDVVFRILEKKEVKVARITIVGNKAISEKTIKEGLETREGDALGFLTGSGNFSHRAFSDDQRRLAQFYYDRGYVKARVGTPKIELSADRTQLFLTIPVEEGERYKTGKVDVSGEFLRPKAELMKLVVVEPGVWFSSSKLQATMRSLGALYKDDGYAYVNVRPDTVIDDKKRTVDLTFDLRKGNKIRIGRIRIFGNTRTRDKVIRREMRLYEGEYFSETGLQRSRRLVTRLGFFEVDPVKRTVEIITRRGDAPDTMDIDVKVVEKATGTFQIGAGFSSLESFVFQAQIAQNNLFGRGQTLSLQATLSKLRTIANIRFADDYLWDTKIRFATNLYSYETNFQDFTRTSLGADLTLGYPLGDDWSIATTYTLEQVKVETGGFGGTRNTPRIANLFTNGITSSARLALYYDTRDNRLFPRSGIFSSASVEEASKYIGSENRFTKFSLQSRYYYSLGFDMVLKANAKWGLITSPEPTGVPIFTRYFVGGPLSVRGFPRFTLGPQLRVPSATSPDAPSEDFNVGGTEQLILNAEFEFPVFKRVGIRGVFFLDAGNAFDREDPVSTKLGELRYSGGFGIRWFSPIGPLRFEWGFPFSPREGEQSSVFEFSIGNFF